MKKLKKMTKRLSLLYVEDDEASREQLKDIFELLFKSVDTAYDGQDGLKKYQQNTYDIVITDINMPRMNGLELIEKIRQINDHQNIIIISAHNDTDNLLKAIDIGVDNFIIKPLKLEQLESILTKVAKYIQANKLMDLYHSELEKELKEKTAKLMTQVVTDELTGLYNRNALVKEAQNSVYKVILLLNIDNFDSLNITYGYDNGDLILKNIANFLKSKIDDAAGLYRLGADEFAIVSYIKTLEQMQEFAQQLQKDVSEYSIKIDNFNIRFTFTMAIAEGSGCLLKNVHIALKNANKLGKNHICTYEKNSSVEFLQLRIQEYMPKLRKIIAKRYITPYFQPIINNRTGEIEKYECLARIVDNTSNVQSPFEFIDIAELTGMIPDITRIMIDKSFKVFSLNNFEFSINISEYDLNDGYLREYLQEKLLEYNINPSRVVVEVLEGISAIGAKESLKQLINLKSDGFSIAIDDFGVQNSNFERVHSLNVDYIKIDGSFIKNIHNDTKSFNVAKTINDFSKSIGAKVIAEYVHSKDVQDVVLELGIEYSQGYYFSQPLSSLKNL